MYIIKPGNSDILGNTISQFFQLPHGSKRHIVIRAYQCIGIYGIFLFRE